MKYLMYVTLVTNLVAGCRQELPVTLISTPGIKAESVYLTNDENDNPVVAWTQREDSSLTLLYSVSHDNGKTFSEKVKIPLTPDVATHPESMPKVAFKGDGSIVVAYEKKAPTKENKYASAIYYLFSNDNGKSWSPEKFLHTDTTAGRSRSYFDIDRLPDGEIGASWLDIKLDGETGGRSVRFAKTKGSKFFGKEILIDSSACQCCRIDVYSDIAGRVNVAYRGLMKGEMGKSIRDIMLATSTDDGETFSRPMRISKDDWAIDGCPHTGASVCSNKSGLYSFWYTEGNGTGIYYSFKQNSDSAFAQRQLISNSGRHPQLSVNDSRFVMVWEENVGAGEKQFTNVLYQIGNGTQVEKKYLTPKDSNAFSPVVTQTNNGFVAAFLMETKNGTGVYTAGL